LPFLGLPIVLPLAFPLPVLYLILIGGIIICGNGGIRRGQGRMGGPRGNPEPRGPIDGTIGAMPRALGPPGNLGNMPLGRDTPPTGRGGGGGSLCRGPPGPNIGFNGGGNILGGMPCGGGGGASLPANLGGGSCRAPAGGNLGAIRGPLFNGLILLLRYFPPILRKEFLLLMNEAARI